MRVTPIWVVPGVSDKFSYVLAIRDEQTLQKTLKPLEQAELYEEFKALYAEDAERRDAATRFGAAGREQAEKPGERAGGAESAPPWPLDPNEGKARVQAARAVTGQGLADDAGADQPAQTDRRRRCRRPVCASTRRRSVVGDQRGPESQRPLPGGEDQAELGPSHALAEHPDTPEQARTAAATRTSHPARTVASPAEAAKESGLALARVTEIHKAATDPALIGWKDVDPLLREKHAIRKLVDFAAS